MGLPACVTNDPQHCADECRVLGFPQFAEALGVGEQECGQPMIENGVPRDDLSPDVLLRGARGVHARAVHRTSARMDCPHLPPLSNRVAEEGRRSAQTVAGQSVPDGERERTQAFLPCDQLHTTVEKKCAHLEGGPRAPEIRLAIDFCGGRVREHLAKAPHPGTGSEAPDTGPDEIRNAERKHQAKLCAPGHEQFGEQDVSPLRQTRDSRPDVVRVQELSDRGSDQGFGARREAWGRPARIVDHVARERDDGRRA